MAYCSAVAAVATSNISTGVAGPGISSLDGVTLTNPSRILLTNQSTPSQHGVWIWTGSAAQLARPAAGDPFHSGVSLDNATVVPVAAGGVTWGGSRWWINTPATGAITVDTTSITLVRQNAQPVQARVATTADISLASPGSSIDNIPMNAGDVVLVRAQTSGNGAADNGLYFWNGSSTAMTRTADPIYPNIEVLISEGNTLAHAHYKLGNQGTIVLGTGGSALAFSHQNVFNVMDFGAMGDGHTDDTTAVKAALLAAGSAGGGTVYFPRGNYQVSSSLPVFPSTTIQGDNRGLSAPSSVVTKTTPGDVFQNPQHLNSAGTDAIAYRDLAIQSSFCSTVNPWAPNTIYAVTNVVKPAAVYVVWAPSTVYSLNAMVSPRNGITGYYYEATSIGSAPHQSDTSEPSWPILVGGTVVDSNITWTCFSYSANGPNIHALSPRYLKCTATTGNATSGTFQPIGTLGVGGALWTTTPPQVKLSIAAGSAIASDAPIDIGILSTTTFQWSQTRGAPWNGPLNISTSAQSLGTTGYAVTFGQSPFPAYTLNAIFRTPSFKWSLFVGDTIVETTALGSVTWQVVDAGAAIADVGGAGLSIERCLVGLGCNIGLILDQTEDFYAAGNQFGGGSGNEVGVWVVNGGDHLASIANIGGTYPMSELTNVITFESCLFQGLVGVVDDGQVSHTYYGCDCTGGMAIAGCGPIAIHGCYFEGAIGIRVNDGSFFGVQIGGNGAIGVYHCQLTRLDAHGYLFGASGGPVIIKGCNGSRAVGQAWVTGAQQITGLDCDDNNMSGTGPLIDAMPTSFASIKDPNIGLALGNAIGATGTVNNTLDIAGGVSVRALSISLVPLPALNNNVQTANYGVLTPHANLRVSGVGGAFTVTGFKNGVDGALLALVNVSGQQMTIGHLRTTSDSGNQITCLTGTDIVLPPGNGAVHFIYDLTTSTWICLNYLSSFVHAANSTTIAAARNAANNADIAVLSTDASNDVLVGDGANNANINLNAGASSSVTLQSGGTTTLLASGANIVSSVPTIAWQSAVAGPVIGQNTPTSDAATQALTIKSQAPYGSATTNTSPGNIVLSIPSPVGAGTPGYVEMQNSGKIAAALGYPTTSYTGLFLASSITGVSPASGNYNVLSDGVSTFINAPSGGGTIYFRASNSTALLSLAVGSMQSWLGPLTFVNTVTTAGLAQAAPSSDVATTSLTIQSQAPYASATINPSPGNIVLSIPSPVGAGTPGYVEMQNSGKITAALGYVNTSFTGLFLASSISGVAPAAGNYNVLSDGTSTYVNAPGGGGTIYFRASNSIPLLSLAAGSMQSWLGPLTFVSTVSAGGLVQSAPSSDLPTTSMTIQAQGAYASATGTNKNGAALNVTGGAAASGGTAGSVNIQTGGTTQLAVSPTSIACSQPLAGVSGTPFRFTSSTVALTNMNVTLSNAQVATPCIVVTGTLTGSVSVTFPNLAGFWWLDVGGLALGGGGHTLTLKSGSGSKVITTLATGGLIGVHASGSNTITYH